MKKTNITGWRDVFAFTLIQTLKSKAYLLSLIIMLSLILISMPILHLIQNGTKTDPDAVSPIKTVYINNQTSLADMDFSALSETKALSEISFQPISENYDAVADRIEKSELASVILTLKDNGNSYSLEFVKASKGPVNDSSLQALGSAVAAQFDTIRITSLGIADNQLALLKAPVNASVSMVDGDGNPIVKVDTSISMTEYWFIYGILFVVLMVNMMASTQIASSIVTEKSTRVVEFLLTSVKPLALMMGKILAMLVAVLLQIASMIAVVFVSNTITAVFLSDGGPSMISQYLPKNIFQNLNILNLIFCLLLIGLGLIFYATLAGLAGATVSKMEELQEGLTLFTFTNIIGVYIGLGAASSLMGAGDNPFVTFSCLFPLSSPFILPGAILIGKASLPLVAGAIVLQVVFISLLFQFVAKVYEALILHNGTRLKIKDLVKISKIAKA